jgi:hypothetical protein
MSVRELSSPPSLSVVYPKAVAGAGRAALRRLPGLGGGERELPEVELSLPEVEIDREHLNAYDRVCGFLLRDRLPATYPHVLAFPLAMELMTSTDFPFGVLGLVHVANRIEQLRPLDAGEPFDLRVWAENLAQHPRGRTVDLVAEATVEGDVAWRDRSTYLHRESGGGGGKKDPRGERPRAQAEWVVPGDTGRRYAAVSGDRNPIHLHGVPARLLGQKGAIAHGMWSKARCLAALEPLPAAYTVEVAFKLPILLPAKVAFATWVDDTERRFALHDARSGKPHLEGGITPAASAA